MLEFLIDNIFVIFGGRVFQQTVGIPMGTNCAPLLANLFIYSYETDRLLLSANKRSRENNSRFQDSRFQPQTHKMNPTKKKTKTNTKNKKSSKTGDELMCSVMVTMS